MMHLTPFPLLTVQFLLFLLREEQAYILEKYRRMGATKFWVNYKNENNSYIVDGLDLNTDTYMGNWNKDHTGK